MQSAKPSLVSKITSSMSRLDDWDDPMSTFVLIMLIFGFSTLMILADVAPLLAVALVVLLGIGTVSVLAWTGIHLDMFNNSREETREQDPLSVLKERYARGEISEEEFEHRVTMLLDVNEIAGDTQEAELEKA